MTEWPNVFENQQFLLRRADGTRTRRSFRQIVTGPDEPFSLDYPQEFFNVAALNLLSYLAQAVFEPEDSEELASRIRNPLSDTEFESCVAPLRDMFRLDGPGPRFMQGREPEKKQTPEGLEITLMIAPKGDRSFLYRASPDWGVKPEQAGLLLFMRNTFFEGTAGRGYQKGTNGDTPIRTMVLAADSEDSRALLLRRSLWLNVISRDFQQERYEGDYSLPGDGYDDWFWANPPSDDVPLGGISLSSALSWMSAIHWLHYEDRDDKKSCIVTGESISGHVAVTVSRKSTGIAYGAKGDLDAGVRAERFFRHPNVPTIRQRNRKTGELGPERPILIDRTRGLVNAIGSSFFGATKKGAGRENTLAPAVAQLVSNRAIELAASENQTPPRLLVFGFHMLSTQKNVHGGYELDRFDYALSKISEGDRTSVLHQAEEIAQAISGFADKAAYHLQRNLQLACSVEVRPKETEDGRIQTGNVSPKKSGDYAFGRDIISEYWRKIQELQHDLISSISESSSSADLLMERREFLVQDYENRIAKIARRSFQPVFEQQSTLPRTMPIAHKARIYLYSALKKAMTYQTENADDA